ncbi:MAG: hypothetical protein JJE50_01175 [Actinomycetales bacterium]|nr:hypothetical protein [Actinomycetales bacterium]
MRIEVHIERLVVEGMPLRRGDAAALREAFELELTGRLAGADASAFVPSAEPGRRLSASVGPGGGPRDVGRSVASALGQALRGGEPGR